MMNNVNFSEGSSRNELAQISEGVQLSDLIASR
ncbi:hypothetical protein ACSSV1_005597 [Labrenzia sp. MBR-25]|jgi:hypothetical protein